MTEIKIQDPSAEEEKDKATKKPDGEEEEIAAVVDEDAYPDSENDAGEEPEVEDEDQQPEELTEEEKTYKEQLQRMAADFDNYRRRVSKEKSVQYDRGVISLAQKILPVLDSLDLAVDAARKDHESDDCFLKGIEMVQRMLTDTLTQMKITRIDVTDGTFNPRLHEAMFTEPAKDVPPDTILQELQPGYLYKDQLLRASKVKISVEAEASENSNDKPDTPN